jgi:CopG-like RHH_1 or ribbon-helix-helix domain, RHH_5
MSFMNSIALARNPRLSIALPEGMMEALERWAEAERNRPTSLATFLLEQAIRRAMDEGKIPPPPTGSTRPIAHKTIAEMVTAEWDKLINYGRIPSNRLEALKQGDRPTELDNARLALALGLDEGYVERLSRR